MITTDPLYFRSRSAINLITNNIISLQHQRPLNTQTTTIISKLQSPAEAEVPAFIAHVLILNICQHTRIALKKTYTSNGRAISFFVSKNVVARNTPHRPYICISEASLTSKSVMWIQGLWHTTVQTHHTLFISVLG